MLEKRFTCKSISLLVFVKYKKSRKVLIVLLIVSCITSLSGYGVFANNTSKEVSVNEMITYDGKEITLHSTVYYHDDHSSGSEPKDPVVIPRGC